MEEALIKRIPPHSIEAEQSVIGAMLLDRDAILIASEILTSDDFYQNQYGIIFDAMVELCNEGKPVDLITLQNRLKEKDLPPDISSMEYVRELIEAVPTSANVKYYANIVSEKALLRRLIKATEDVANTCYLEKESTEMILEVIKYIATNIKSNIRELEGAFNKVMASSKLEKKEVTLELAEQALKDIISPDEQKVITPDYIISVVAEHYHVTVADLCGNKRSSKIVMPRQIAMYLCRDIIDTSLKTIGKNLGDRDHTTVMHGIEKIENELKTNDNLKNSIDTLRKKINPQG